VDSEKAEKEHVILRVWKGVTIQGQTSSVWPGTYPCGDTQEEGEAGSGDDRTLLPQWSTAEHSHEGRVSSSRVEPSLSMVLSRHDPGSVMGFSAQCWVELRRFAFLPQGSICWWVKSGIGLQERSNLWWVSPVPCADSIFAPYGGDRPPQDQCWLYTNFSLEPLDLKWVNHFSSRLMFSLDIHPGIIATIFPP
jgi:hypothetical protein